VRRIVYPYLNLLWLILFGLAGCQHLPAPVTSTTPTNAADSAAASVTWEGASIQRENLPTTAVTPDDPVTTDENSADDTPEIDQTGAGLTPDIEPAETSIPDVPAAPQDLDPATFLGASQIDLAANFGAPTMIRHEGKVEVWQYQLPECVIDFFLFETSGQDENTQTMRAAHTDMRSPILGGQLDSGACTRALYAVSQKTSTGQ